MTEANQLLRCLTADELAKHLGFGEATPSFRALLRRAGIAPLPGTRRYYLRAVQEALDRAAGLTPPAEKPDPRTAYERSRAAADAARRA